jgi:hypothetical protein
MTPNLWQYIVLMEGLGGVATAAGLAYEALRRDHLQFVGYANIGAALIALSECVNLCLTLSSSPTLSTWIAAAGFAVYFVATAGMLISRGGLHRLDRWLDRRHGLHA